MLKFFMENTLNSEKREKVIIVDRKNLFIFQMFIIKLRNWIIPFKDGLQNDIISGHA